LGTAWKLRGNCANNPSILDKQSKNYLVFDSAYGNSKQVERAKRLCAGCPVINRCLVEAFTILEMERKGRPIRLTGVWAGMSTREIRKYHQTLAPETLRLLGVPVLEQLPDDADNPNETQVA